MSGHGRFSAIGSGMKVPQPFDLPKIEDLKLGDNKLGALNVEGHKDEVQVADTRIDQTNRLAANLDTMLLRVAKTASAPVDVKALKETLVVAGLDKATRKAIEGAAKKAQTSFQAINQFSGRQIADALVKDEKGRFDWDEANPVGKAIKAALDAQADLSELLYNALNSLPDNANARARNALMEAMFQTDRRASELQTLVCDFADMAEKVGNDPAIKARLDKTLKSLIPSQSLKMHGSEKIAADFRTSLMPLAKRIDDLASVQERQLSDDEATKIRRQIDEAYNALAKAETTYAAKGTPTRRSTAPTPSPPDPLAAARSIPCTRSDTRTARPTSSSPRLPVARALRGCSFQRAPTRTRSSLRSSTCPRRGRRTPSGSATS